SRERRARQQTQRVTTRRRLSERDLVPFLRERGDTGAKKHVLQRPIYDGPSGMVDVVAVRDRDRHARGDEPLAAVSHRRKPLEPGGLRVTVAGLPFACQRLARGSVILRIRGRYDGAVARSPEAFLVRRDRLRPLV